MIFIENERIELKREMNENVERAIVAFLNSHNGVIYIGVEDNGTINGVEKLDKVMKEIADIIVNNILPSCQELINISAKYVEGKMIIEIQVKKGRALYYIKKYGRSSKGCYIRVGTSSRSMTEQQIETEYIKSINLPLPSMVNTECYNQNLSFEILKTNLIVKGFHINEDTFYKNYNLLTKDNKFNLLANLLADVNDVSIQIVRFSGKDKSELIERKEYGYKSIIASINRMIDRLEAINITKSTIQKVYRRDERLLNMKCLREAFINAIVHNDWVDGNPPIIYVYSDRIEILSTGGLPKNLSLEEFYNGISKPRNRELMRIFSDLELVERSGYGVPKIISKYGIKVFDVTENFINVKLPFNIYLKGDVSKNKTGEIKEGTGELNLVEQEETGKIKEETGELNLVEQEETGEIKEGTGELNLVEQEETGEIKEGTGELNVVEQEETGGIKEGTGELNLVEQEETGEIKEGTGELNVVEQEETGGIKEGTGEINIGDIHLSDNEYKIIKLIDKNMYIKRKDLMQMSNLSKNTIDRIIKDLKDKNIIARVGAKRNGYWVIKNNK